MVPTTPDEELEAIATVLRTLAALDPAARSRVLWYAADWVKCQAAKPVEVVPPASE